MTMPMAGHPAGSAPAKDVTQDAPELDWNVDLYYRWL